LNLLSAVEGMSIGILLSVSATDCPGNAVTLEDSSPQLHGLAIACRSKSKHWTQSHNTPHESDTRWIMSDVHLVDLCISLCAFGCIKSTHLGTAASEYFGRRKTILNPVLTIQ
jgi:hypothetical protein